MPKFKTKPVYVEAIQWFPGVEVPGLITDPAKLIGVPGAHIGHQCEVGPKCGVLLEQDGRCSDEFVQPGWWVVTHPDGIRVSVYGEHFAEQYEPAE
jgi:hypothetical protein